jgi:hypothetical protein
MPLLGRRTTLTPRSPLITPRLLLFAALPALMPLAAHAQNLLPNGTFELGNTGFASDYSFSSGGNCCEGQYTVRNNGSSFNGSFVNPPPSIPGSSLMMVINGSTVPNQRIWFASVSPLPGRTYRLSLNAATAVAGGPARLQWQLNGTLIGSPTTLPDVSGTWITHSSTWTAPLTAAPALVAVRNLNTSTFPNDFYIDNLSMTIAACSPADIANTDGDTILTNPALGGPDNTLDNGDFVAFFSAFFAPESDPTRLAADIANTDGDTILTLGGPDNTIDNGDFSAFFSLFFQSCP